MDSTPKKQKTFLKENKEKEKRKEKKKRKERKRERLKLSKKEGKQNSLNLVKRSLHGFNPTASLSVSAKAVLQSLVNFHPEPSNGECVNGFKEHLTVDLLFHEDLVHSITSLYRVLRDYLVSKGFSYQKHPNTHCPINGIAYSFFVTMKIEALYINANI